MRVLSRPKEVIRMATVAVPRFETTIVEREKAFVVTFHFVQLPGATCMYCSGVKEVMTQCVVVDGAKGGVSDVVKKTPLFAELKRRTCQLFLHGNSVCKGKVCAGRYMSMIRQKNPRRITA